MTLPGRPSQVTQILALIVIETRANAHPSPGMVVTTDLLISFSLHQTKAILSISPQCSGSHYMPNLTTDDFLIL